MALFAAAILARAAPPPSLQADLQAVVNAQAVQWNTSFSLGLSWGDGSEVLAVAAGADNHAAGTTVNTSTLYPLGSATKMYTAVACLQLAEQNKLDLDAPLASLRTVVAGQCSRQEELEQSFTRTAVQVVDLAFFTLVLRVTTHCPPLSCACAPRLV